MVLIVAILLIIIVVAKCSTEKINIASSKLRSNQLKTAEDDWKDKYVDDDLEKKLMNCIADPDNYEEVRKEFESSILCSKYWRANGIILNSTQIPTDISQKRIKEFVETMEHNQNTVLPIMLANRCKVFSFYTTDIFGENNAYLCSNYPKEYKESIYEYFTILQNILNKNGVDVHLVYNNNSDTYIFDNPSLENDRVRGFIEPFDKHLLDRINNKIPPIGGG